MGIGLAGTKLLLQEGLRRSFTGCVLTLGKQTIHYTLPQLQGIAESFNYPCRIPAVPTLSHNPHCAPKQYISDTCLFHALGFAECYSLDCSDYEGADFIFDMNRNRVPPELAGRFDLIYDGGTLEHVFHVPHVLNNIFAMLRPGGRIVHASPSSNHIDHGFYMFSPTLFWDFYCANQFEINAMQVFRHTQNSATEPWEISNYQPGCLFPVSYGGLDDGMYGIFCVATKTSHSTGTVVPMQNSYLGEWVQGNTQDTQHTATAPQLQLAASNRNRARLPAAVPMLLPVPVIQNSPPPPRLAGLRQRLQNVPLIYPALRFGYRFVRHWSKRLASPLTAGALTTSCPPTPAKGLKLEVVARFTQDGK